MNSCSRPLDPLDAEAVASGETPLFAGDAAAHAASCPDCGRAVAEVSRLTEDLDRFSDAASPEASGETSRADLAARVLRIRPFSRRERRHFAYWRAPILLAAAVFAAGSLCLLAPGITAREQAGLGVAALAPLAAFLRALARSLAETAGAFPRGLQALSAALRGHPVFGLAALLLLAPALAALKRAAARRSAG